MSLSGLEKAPQMLACFFPSFLNSSSSQGESYDDLEILDIVEFLIIFITRGVGELISAECKFFYPVAFFLGAFKGTRCYDVIICTSCNGRKKNSFKYGLIIHR